MTSITPTDYPRPATWQDFSHQALVLLSAHYRGKFRRWGGGSKRKDGVDAWTKLADGKVVAARFEGRDGNIRAPLTRAAIDTALAEAASFPQPIDELLILTTAPDDEALVQGLAATRQPGAPAKLTVWGWQTICRHIDQQPVVQRKVFGISTKAPGKSRVALALAALLIVAGGAGSLFLSKNALDKAKGSGQDSAASITEIVGLVDGLDEVYGQCGTTLDTHVFTFSHALIANCRDAATERLLAMSKRIDKLRPGLDPNSQSEVSRLLVIFNEDVREAAVAAASAYSFESQLVDGMKAGCTPGRGSEAPRRSPAEVRTAGDAAMTAQLRYYFLLRDFIVPEMAAARTILELHASATGQPAPEDMKEAAARMERLLTERAQYDLKTVARPFSLSADKQASDRSGVKDAGKRTDAGEEALWRQVQADAATQALHGRPKDVEALIACGALKPADAATPQASRN